MITIVINYGNANKADTHYSAESAEDVLAVIKQLQDDIENKPDEYIMEYLSKVEVSEDGQTLTVFTEMD